MIFFTKKTAASAVGLLEVSYMRQQPATEDEVNIVKDD